MRNREWGQLPGREVAGAVGGPQPDEIRAANADREATAELLRTHHAVGRITDDEFQQRLEQSMAARTLGDLRALVADLPRPAVQDGPARGWRRGPFGVRFLPILVGVALLSAIVGRHAAWHYGHPGYGYPGFGHPGFGHHAFGYHGFGFPGPLLILALAGLFALTRRWRYAARRSRWV